MRLEPGREALPLVVAEVRVGRAGGDDQVVVGELAVGRAAPVVRRGRTPVASASSTVVFFCFAQDRAERIGDVARVERGGRDLVEQRLEQMVVAPVDQRDLHRRVLRGPCA